MGNNVTKPAAKPWWQSKGVVGGFIAAAAPVVALFGVDVDVEQTTQIARQCAGLVGGVLAVYGRVKADSPVRFKRGD